MSDPIVTLLLGAGIGFVSAILMAYFQHRLSLNADKEKRERDTAEKRRVAENLMLLKLEYGDTFEQVMKQVNMTPREMAEALGEEAARGLKTKWKGSLNLEQLAKEQETEQQNLLKEMGAFERKDVNQPTSSTWNTPWR